uniref:Ninein (GSK3B interacting protein) n=1 Tax=Acanthochromis polyacanthus TaxID=80966 RepID=A0A3Q1F6M5_9TELE
MDDGQEQDQYEERLKEVFNSFDASGCGSLCPEELSDLCQSLHLDDATPALLQALLQNQDRLTARVDFDQFKNALILVLSSTIEAPQSPEIQPKFVKGSKRYGRRSTPEFIEPVSDLSEVPNISPADGEDLEDSYDSAVPRKREVKGSEFFQHRSEPPDTSMPPLSSPEERLREACEDLAITWDGCAGHTELLALCEHVGLEITGDTLLSLTGDGVMNVQEFVSRVVNHSKPPTPSASTPYRQLKRLHSTQPFDEGGRRIATPSALTSSIGMRLFSTLDDGTGYTHVECILDAWIDEGIENSTEILQALNFSLDGKLSLSDLTMALENELLVTKNGIHQAALASFKAEIRYLLERVDREIREKEKIRSDLEKAEKLKTQLATEVDEHHSAIEQMNNLNLRKLEQDHKEKLAAVRSELMNEMDQIQQQAGLQREELEAEIEKIREDESFLRDHLSIAVKDNRRLETELLDGNEKLVEAQGQITKLQTSLDNLMKDKFGDLDPGTADFFLQEERIKQLRSSYEAQCRVLQDRIDELQSELQEFHSLGQTNQLCHKPLSEELESKSPGMESDPGIGSEEVQPFSMSLEAEMMLEQLKEQHLQEVEDLRNQLERKVILVQPMFNSMEELRKQHASAVKKLKEEHAELFEACLAEERKKLQEEKAELENRLLDDWEAEKQQLQESHEDELKAKLEEVKLRFEEEREEMVKGLTEQWQKERARLDEQNNESLQMLLEEEMLKLIREQEEKESKLREQWEKERSQLQQLHEEVLLDRVLEERLQLQEQFEQREKKVKEEWERERLQLEEDYEGMIQDRELKALSESHVTQKLQWEAEMHKALENIEEQIKMMEEAMEQERERLNEEWTKERQEIESVHSEEMEALMVENKQLQNELDELMSKAQTKEIELSRQLNDLHNRLQESLDTKHELVVQIENKAHETELLLAQTVEDFKQERAELLRNNSELEAKYNEMLSMSERQIMERIELLTERDDLKMKIEELENLLKQAAVDFELERKELQENVSLLEEKLKDNLKNEGEKLQAETDGLKTRIKELEMELNQAAEDFEFERKELQENVAFLEEKCKDNTEDDREELRAENDGLKNRIKELEMELQEVLAAAEKDEKEEMKESNEIEILNVSTLLDQGGDAETNVEAGEDTENVKNVDQQDDENVSSTSDDKEGNDMMEAASNEEPNNKSFVQDEMTETHDLWPETVFGEGCDDEVDVLSHEACELSYCDHNNPESPEDVLNLENKPETASPEMQRESISSPEAFHDGEDNEVLESCSKENKPQDVLEVDCGSFSHEDELHREIVVVVSTPEETGDTCELSPEDAEVNCSKSSSHDCGQEGEHLTAKIKHDWVETLVEDADEEHQEKSILKLHSLYKAATEENVLLHEKISLLQQKTDILENLLAYNNEKIKTGHQILEENYGLKVKMLLLMEHVKELEIQALKITDLQIRYEDCMCENAKLKDQNGKLEKRIWSLEGKINVFHDFQDQQISLVDEISRMREENAKLSELLGELEMQDGILSVEHPDAEESEEVFVDLEVEVQAVTDLDGCCKEFEKQNTKLRRAITELQDKSQTLNETTQTSFPLKVRTADETLQAVNHQSARLKSDLRVLQQDKDSLKHEVAVLHKQLQNMNEKNQILEMALHSSGLQNQSKKLYRDEMSRLKEHEQQLLRQENESLQAEVHSIKGDLVQAREKVSRGMNLTDTVVTHLPAFSLQGPMAEQRAAHADSYRRIGGL